MISRDSRGQISPFPMWAATLIAVVVLAVVVLELLGGISGTYIDQMEAAQQWCNSLNGTLTMERAIINGGAHCQTPNGSLIRYQGQNL